MAQRTVGTLQKDPEETRTFKMDWSAHLETQLIANSTWTVPAGITLVTSGIVEGNTKTYIVLAGGTAGNSYIVSNRIWIAGTSDIYERSGTVLVRQY